MAKKRGQRRRKKLRKPQAPKQVQSEQSATDLLIAKRIAVASFFIFGLVLIPCSLMVSSEEVSNQAEKLRWITFGSGVLLTWVAFWLIRAGRGILTFEEKSAADVRAFRKNGVWTLSTLFFLNINEWIPILYEKGYLSKLSQLFLGQKFGDKLTLGGTFILGAIASGIFGNLSYDVLKAIFRRMTKQS